MSEKKQQVTSEDYQKYFLALASQSVRRIAAWLQFEDLHTDVHRALISELRCAMLWQQMAVVVDRPSLDNFNVYSDGRHVVSVIGRTNGYATVVHDPDSMQPEPEDADELAEEICLGCGGMPTTEPGIDEQLVALHHWVTQQIERGEHGQDHLYDDKEGDRETQTL
jgi:hypothetical protein